MTNRAQHLGGPYTQRPDDASLPVNTNRWEQTRDGKWYAFHHLVGPGTSFALEHPNDPHFWASSDSNPEPDATGPNSWTCRHGTHWLGLGVCREGCPPEPTLFVPPTDEEVEQTAERLAALVSSMESK